MHQKGKAMLVRPWIAGSSIHPSTAPIGMAAGLVLLKFGTFLRLRHDYRRNSYKIKGGIGAVAMGATPVQIEEWLKR